MIHCVCLIGDDVKLIGDATGQSICTYIPQYSKNEQIIHITHNPMHVLGHMVDQTMQDQETVAALAYYNWNKQVEQLDPVLTVKSENAIEAIRSFCLNQDQEQAESRRPFSHTQEFDFSKVRPEILSMIGAMAMDYGYDTNPYLPQPILPPPELKIHCRIKAENTPMTGPSIIPKRLFMIWLGSSDIPAYAFDNYIKWRTLMPDWDIQMWRNKDLARVEDHRVLAKINETRKGVQKADILFYYLMSTYGGIYVDCDVTPNRCLDPITRLSPLVLCHDNSVESDYLSKGFLACVPFHPLLEVGLRWVLKATVNTSDIHLKTGPYLIGRATYFLGSMVGTTMLDTYAFYVNHQYPQRFGTHEYAFDWM